MRGASVAVLSLLLAAGVTARSAGAESSQVIGTVPWLLSASGAKCALYEECSLGDAAADAVMRAAGSDVAIVCGGDLRANLMPGELTRGALEESFAPDRELAVAEVTPRVLAQLLEKAVSHVVRSGRRIDEAASADGAFPQVAGLRFTYDPDAPVGQKIVNMKLIDVPVDPADDATPLKLAATVHMLSGGWGLPPVEAYEPLGVTLTDAMAAYVANGLDDYSIPANRITAIGVSRSSFPTGYLALVCGVIVAVTLLFGATTRKRKHMVLILDDDGGLPKEAPAAPEEQKTDPE